MSAAEPASGTANNNSTLTKVENVAKNRFWETLDKKHQGHSEGNRQDPAEGSSETTIEH